MRKYWSEIHHRTDFRGLWRISVFCSSFRFLSIFLRTKGDDTRTSWLDVRATWTRLRQILNKSKRKINKKMPRRRKWELLSANICAFSDGQKYFFERHKYQKKSAGPLISVIFCVSAIYWSSFSTRALGHCSSPFPMVSPLMSMTGHLEPEKW